MFVTLMTLICLESCRVTCMITWASPGTTIVMFETVGSAVGPTFNVSILYPRPEINPTILARTPG